MQSLFAAAGQAQLDRWVRPGLLCAFDFDGTLAPIVSEPGKARTSRAVRRRLALLAEMTPVAILTGRALADIRARIGFMPAYMVGNHGLEGLDEDVEAARRETDCRHWLAQLKHWLRHEGRSLADAGVMIEDKRYSLSLHFRAAPDADAVAVALAEAAALLEPPPRLVAGKCVLNLLPPGSGDKGSALQEILRRSGAPAALYVGDDVTDEAVFRLSLPSLLSVRVDYLEGSAAQFYIPGHADIERLLEELHTRLVSSMQTS